MGTCFSAAVTSSTGNSTDRPTAKIVCADGSLLEYSIPVCVSRVLGSKSLSTAGFLCNSDSLYLGSYVPAMSPDEFIELGQLYFLLPVDMLRHELHGSEMAALAVEAYSALASVEKKNRPSRGRSNHTRVLPHADVHGGEECGRLDEDDSMGILDSNSRWARKDTQKTDPSWPQIVHGIKLTAIEEVAE